MAIALSTTPIEIPVRYESPRVNLDHRLSGTIYGYTGSDKNGTAGKAGIDVRYKSDSGITGLLSVNPDFADVPMGPASIDFSYSEKLREERRPFFLEGQGYYASPSSFYSPFNSVRVDNFDAGAKVYGKTKGGTSVGAYTSETFDPDRRRNDSVVTVRQDLPKLGEAGFQYVSRTTLDQSNSVAAGSLNLRQGDLGLESEYSRSSTDGTAGTSFGGQLSWGRRPWSAAVSYLSTDVNFLALDGFVPFVDQRGVTLNAGYSRDFKAGLVRFVALSAQAERFHHFDGSLFRDDVTFGFDMGTVANVGIFAKALYGRFEQFHDHVYTIGARKNEGKGSYGVAYSFGQYGGELYSRLAPFLEWSTDRLTASISSETVQHGFLQQQNIVEASYKLFRDTLVFGRLVQKNQHNGSYIAIRQNLSKDLDVTGYFGDPNSLQFERRLILKVSYRF